MSRSRWVRYHAVAQAAHALLEAEWMIRCRPFASTAKRLSQPVAHVESARGTLRQAREVRAALDSLCRRLPWRPTCLVRAVAAHTMLAKRHISTTLVLSVAPNEGSVLKAHAWLEAAGIVITGRDEMEKFVPIYRFDNHSAQPLESVAPCSR